MLILNQVNFAKGASSDECNDFEVFKSSTLVSVLLLSVKHDTVYFR